MSNLKRVLTFRDKTQSIPAWSRELGLPESTIRSRIDHLGMTVEEALSRPIETRFRPINSPVAPRVRPAPELQEEAGRAVVRWIPAESLRGRDKESRYLTAALLIYRYTQGVPGKSKKVAIDAEESRLILTALAEADWKPNQPGRNFQLEPLQAFFRLGLTPTDGWNRPREFKDFSAAAQKWLNDHVGTYRIQRTVPVEP